MADKDFHVGIWSDAEVRKRNLKAGKPLCEHCDGTGNEFYAMYRACKVCGGTGVYEGSHE